MQKPSRKTMIVAGAATAGLIVLGGAVAVAQAAGSTDGGPVTDPAANTNVAVDATTGGSTNQATPNTRIGAEQAKRIALQTVPGARVTEVDFDSADPNDEDVSDRVAQWEIDLVRGNTVYDVDIDANSGAVLKNRSEVDDDHGSDDRDGSTSDDHGDHHRSGDDDGAHHDRHDDD